MNPDHPDAFIDEDEAVKEQTFKIDTSIPVESDNPFDTQIGGGHYKDLAIQPMELSLKNNLNAAQHTAIKYIMRYRDKNGLEDLKKAKHTIDLLIQHEYGE